MRNILKKLVEKLLEKPLRKLAKWAAEQNAAADAAREAEASGGTAATDAGGMGVPASPSSEAGVSFPLAGSSSENPPPSSKPWRECRKSSNWNGSNAAKRMMNAVSPKFAETKFREYLDWQVSLGCDHAHLLLVNEADGEGSGYDCLADAGHKAVALARVREIRSRSLGVVAWVVADDSNGYRQKIFADPKKYAKSLADFFPYISYIVIGLEMDEKLGDEQIPIGKWKSLRDAVRDAGWTGPFATHHTSGKYTYASLGEIVCDQLDPSCTASQIKSSVRSLRNKGFNVVGFEYSRGPDRAKAQAALDAGAFGCGNWGK